MFFWVKLCGEIKSNEKTLLNMDDEVNLISSFLKIVALGCWKSIALKGGLRLHELIELV